ncbi:MAG: hypothetical protein ABI203_05900 [Mucilaginibacter sp.]
MSDTNSSSKTAIIVAVIGLLGTIITVTVNNWNKNATNSINSAQHITQPDSSKNTGYLDTNVGNTKIQEPNDDSTHDTKLFAHQLVNNFLKELKLNNINSLVDMSDVPFYYEDKIMLTLSDLRYVLQRDVPESSKTFPKVKSIKSQTVREWEQEHPFKENPTEWNVLRSLKIPDNGYISVASLEKADEENASIDFFINKIGSQFKIIGIFE